MNKQNNSGYLITPTGDLHEGAPSIRHCSYWGADPGSITPEFAGESGMASRWKDWCYKRNSKEENKNISEKDKAHGTNLKKAYKGGALGPHHSTATRCDRDQSKLSSWDGATGLYRGGILKNYLDGGCSESSQKQINDDWESWGGVYPHTASNLVGYGADGKWGSEDNSLSGDHQIYFHTMSPLSIIGEKTFKDLSKKYQRRSQIRANLGVAGWNSKSVKKRGSKGYVLSTSNNDGRVNYRPRHIVRTSMTSCTHGEDPSDLSRGQVDGKGNFQELSRNKLFFEKNQRSTTLYPSELSSQTTPARAPKIGNIVGEKAEVAKGGILRGCMRRSRDYDSTNLLHCCIMGKPYQESNDKRSNGIKYTCPSRYCRGMEFYKNLTPFQKNYADGRKYIDSGVCGRWKPSQWNSAGRKVDVNKPCFVMSQGCKQLGKNVCSKPIDNNPILETLCDSWSAIQLDEGGKFKKNRCTWFINDAVSAKEVKQLLSKKAPIVSFTDRELALLKKLNNTLNNDACKSVISSLVSSKSNELNLKKWCGEPTSCVERAYGKCLPKDKSSPIPPKIKQSPSPTEIKMCKDKKDDPIECERSGDCIFEFKGKNGQEYKASDKASDPGVVRYYRKTFKGALLSSNINHYDNKFKGEELKKVLKDNNIYNHTNSEGIGADICGCHLNTDKNDYNTWYKKNKLQWGKKDQKADSIEKGRPPECWLSECTGSNYKDKSPGAKAKCRDVFLCQQKVEIEINGAIHKGLNLPKKQDCRIQRDVTKTKMNVGRDAATQGGANTDFTNRVNTASKVSETINTDTDDAIDNLDNDDDDDSGISTTLILIIVGSAIGLVVLLLIMREYINK